LARGRRPLPWIKLWHDMLGDAKMAQLSAVEKWCWVGVLLLAGQSPVRGQLMLTETKPMTENDIYRALMLFPKEKKSCRLMIQKMTEMGSLKWNSNGCLEVVHFKERQEVYASDFIDYHKELTPDKLLKDSELSPEKLQKEGRGRRKIFPLYLTVKGATRVLPKYSGKWKRSWGSPRKRIRTPFLTMPKRGSSSRRCSDVTLPGMKY